MILIHLAQQKLNKSIQQFNYYQIQSDVNYIINQLSKKSNKKQQQYKIQMRQQAQQCIGNIIQIKGQLIKYLQSNSMKMDGDNVCNKIYKLLRQKDDTISTMQSHITKYKAQQLRNNKMISQLQQKITQLCPSANDTGSNFMMPSQFKDYFQQFMKNSLSSCLSPLLPYPQAYSIYTKQLLSTTYKAIKQSIDKKITQICHILSLQHNTDNFNKVRLSLLKLMQDNWENILLKQIKQQIQKQTQTQTQKQTQNQNMLSKFIKNMPQYQNQQIKEIIQSQQFVQLDRKIMKICSYMILQQKQWDFIFANDKKIQKYSKKDYVCIDGWIKQQQNVIVILQGLFKQNQDGNIFCHPNLKNYVIPFKQQEFDSQYKLIPIAKCGELKQCQSQVKIFPLQNITFSSKINVQKIDQYCQYSPKQVLPVPPKILRVSESCSIKQNLSNNYTTSSGVIQVKTDLNYSSKNKKQQEQQQQKQFYSKIETAIRKLNKIQAKHNQNNLQTDSVSVLLSPNVPKVMKTSSHHNSNNTLKIHAIQHTSQANSVNPSITMVKSSKLKNGSKNCHNLISDPSFEQILTLPQRKKDILEQMPLKRQSSRTKKSNSRKASAGKIVGQTIESKQNMLHRNNRQNTRQKDRQRENKQNTNKQAIYKDMIKQKLGNEHKTERQKVKQSKHKQKDEDRPLRIMHFKKIRQKYLNL